ncbi:sialidase family protein [Dehalobacter sp. 14DCB1]|uniref:sialidase family protein n=1 Tax=Dehalobacter sp. 14DCB1 TaxID=2070227 RepID=UPI0010459A59|nr:sialidase family protein [Dehalobacter sp. 14DCB1]TCX53826.1 hypothetical protein C1I36_03590 [Dehalobacter sp. 14DCB1]
MRGQVAQAGGVPMQLYRDLLRDKANLTAITDIYNRVSGAQGVYYDLFDNTNNISASTKKNMVTNTTSALNAGETNILAKVNTAIIDKPTDAWFGTGEEITIQDDVHKERVTVTSGGSNSTLGTVDKSTAVTVVEQLQGLGTEYNGDSNNRKLVRLDGGRLVLATHDGNVILLYTSTDNGTTWRHFHSIGSLGGYTSANIYSCSVACKDTSVYVFVTGYLSALDRVQLHRYDFSTGVASYTTVETNSIITSWGNYPSGDMTISGNNIYMCWSSYTTDYADVGNVRYVKGTIAIDGGVTIGTPAYISKNPSSGWYARKMSIVVFNGYVHIFVVGMYSGNYTMYVFTNANTTQSWLSGVNFNPEWGNKTFNPSTLDAYGSISTAVTDTAIIVAANYTYSSGSLLAVVKTTDNGTTYTKLDGTAGYDTIILDGSYLQRYPSLAVDASNNVHLCWSSATSAPAAYLKHIKFSNNAWGTAATLATIHATANAYNSHGMVSLCNNYSNFTQPLCVYQYISNNKIRFTGVWTDYIHSPSLTVSPLLYSYKSNALVYRSLGKIVNNKLGFSNGYLETIASYDRSTPVSIVGSAYSTNNGNASAYRKLIRLSNGWLIASAYLSATYIHYFYKSEDNGATWSQLCYMSNGSDYSSNNISMVAKGTKVIVAALRGSGVIDSWTFDATTQTNVNIYSVSRVLAMSTGSTLAGFSMDVDSNGKIWIAAYGYCTSYTSYYNIMITSSTDDGATWAAYTRLTNVTAGGNCTGASIVFRNNYVHIFTYYTYSSTYVIFEVTNELAVNQTQGFNNVNPIDGWKYSTIWYTSGGAGWSQNPPVAVCTKNGDLHVAWVGCYIDGLVGMFNLKTAYSCNGGASWSTPYTHTRYTATYSQYSPTISYNDDNEVYVYWYGLSPTSPTYPAIHSLKYSSGKWGTVTELYKSASNNLQEPSALAYQPYFSAPPVIYKDMAAPAVKFAGSWSAKSLRPLLEEDVRYDIEPITDTNEIVSWVTYDTDAGLTVDSKISIVDAAAAESFGDPTVSTYGTPGDTTEKQYVYSTSRNEKVTQRITLTRTSTALEKFITKILGAIGV